MNVIQIGCHVGNDHVTQFIQNNISNIEKFVIIDAISKYTEKAKNDYAFLGDRLISVNVAISDRCGITSFFLPKNGCESHASLIEAHVLNRMGYKESEKIYLPCLDLNTVIDSLEIKEISHLFIDTEGYDAKILLALDFDRVKIGEIFFEHEHSHEYNEKLRDKLKSYNYRVNVLDGGNTLAVKE